MLRKLRPNEFEQGTLFTCGLSNSYPKIPTMGLLITARCDTAQNKASVLNYLPVVPVEAWIKKDGLAIVAKRAMANAFGSMKSTLIQAGMSPTIVDLISHDNILQDLKADAAPKIRSFAPRFEAALANCSEAKRILVSGNLSETEIIDYLIRNESFYKPLIKELMTNAIADYHYIEKIDDRESSRGHVALMREIRFITAPVGRKIAQGLDQTNLSESDPEFSPSLNHLRFCTEHEFAMPISCISSPYIELILQRFTNLFSRIGVDDLPIQKLVDAQSWVKTWAEGLQ